MDKAKKWFPCELHCHTVHSDGDFTVETLLQTARERGLDGICLTDHNTTAGWAEIPTDSTPAVLCGMEWTTYFGHMPVLDCREYVDWRDATPENIDEKLRAVHDRGGLCGMAHPYQIGTPICTGGFWEFQVKDYTLLDYIEVWAEGAPYYNAANSRAQKKWQSLLDAGYHIAPTMGRDWHRPTKNRYPTACTYLLCPTGALTPEKMKTALKTGRTSVCVGPLFYFETACGATVGDTVPAGETELRFCLDDTRYRGCNPENQFLPREIRLLTNGGESVLCLPVAAGENTCTATVHLERNRYYRAELWGDTDGKPNTQLALTAAMYTE